MRTFHYILAFVLLSELSLAQAGLIAYYPLNSNPNDTTGNLGPVTLTNVPYQEGGVYCNGIYGGSNLQTPILPDTIYKSFSLTVMFKVTDFPTGPNRPVLIGGGDYRWVGFYLMTDSTVALYYNNGFFHPCTVHYTTNTWHTATLNYDSSVGMANLSIDGVLACSANFTAIHGSSTYDRVFMSTDLGTGKTYKGYLKDLKFYSTFEIPTSVSSRNLQEPESMTLLQNYPNPFNPCTTIRFRIDRSSFVSLDVYDILGQKIASLMSRELTAGEHEVQSSAEGFSSGVYFCRMQTGNNIQIRKLILNK